MNDLAGSKGDIFWNLAPFLYYAPGAELGCIIYVANPTDEEKEYSLMGRLSADDVLISEEVITVFGHSWFKVAAGDFVRLYGALIFNNTAANLTVSLIERESDEETDSVSTYLAEPTTALWPYTWPSTPATLGVGFDWSSLIILLMFGALGGMVVSAIGEKKEEEKLSVGRGS